MTIPDSIGGKVLDASGVAAIVEGRLSAMTWLDVARATGTVLYMPALAAVEVSTVRPRSAVVVADLAAHPQIIVGEVDAFSARAIDDLLDGCRAFDALAGQVVHEAGRRNWPVLTDDPDRVERLGPDVECERI